MDDVLGGDRQTWVSGATFDAAIVPDSSVEVRVGEAMVVSNTYTVTTFREKVLEYHEVFRRVSDGKIFRVTTGDAADRKTPESTELDMRQVNAEEYSPAGAFAVPSTPLTPATPTEVLP